MTHPLERYTNKAGEPVDVLNERDPAYLSGVWRAWLVEAEAQVDPLAEYRPSVEAWARRLDRMVLVAAHAQEVELAIAARAALLGRARASGVTV